MENILQIWILLSSGSAVWLMSDTRPSRQRAGCWIGLSGIPGWLTTAYLHFQWGIFLLTIIFTVSYMRGILRHGSNP